MARWDQLPKITKQDLKRLYQMRTERDYGGYENFNEFCLAEYERTERTINRLLLKAGRRSPLTKKRIRLKEKRETERRITQSFRAKYEAWKSSAATSSVPSDAPRDVRSDVPRLLSDVPRPSRNSSRASNNGGNQHDKELSDEELSIDKGNAGHDISERRKNRIPSDRVQQRTTTEPRSTRTDCSSNETVPSGSKDRSQSPGRSHSEDAPSGEPPEYHLDPDINVLEWLFTKEELEELTKDLGTFRGKHR